MARTTNTTENKRNSNVAEEQATTNNPELVDHDPRGTARNEAILLMQQSNRNLVEMGATCADKRFKEGNEIIKDGIAQIDPNTGEVKKYADTYYVTLTFDGGEAEAKITKEEYDHLRIGGRYLCSGRIGKVKIYVNNSMSELMMPIYTSFVELY